MLYRFLELLKIFWDGFEMIKISKNCVGFAGANAGSAIGAMLAIDASSGDTVRLSIDNANNIKDIKIAFKFSKNN